MNKQAETVELTERQKKALVIIRDRGPIRPREFAMFMWPESDRWNNLVNCGKNGVHRGGGMYRAAGGYLGKLTKKKFIVEKIVWTNGDWTSHGFYLTDYGKKVLDECCNDE